MMTEAEALSRAYGILTANLTNYIGSPLKERVVQMRLKKSQTLDVWINKATQEALDRVKGFVPNTEKFEGALSERLRQDGIIL